MPVMLTAEQQDAEWLNPEIVERGRLAHLFAATDSAARVKYAANESVSASSLLATRPAPVGSWAGMATPHCRPIAILLSMNDNKANIAAGKLLAVIEKATLAMHDRIAEAKGLTPRLGITRTPDEDRAAAAELRRVEAEWGVAFRASRDARNSLNNAASGSTP